MAATAKEPAARDRPILPPESTLSGRLDLYSFLDGCEESLIERFLQADELVLAISSLANVRIGQSHFFKLYIVDVEDRRDLDLPVERPIPRIALEERHRQDEVLVGEDGVVQFGVEALFGGEIAHRRQRIQHALEDGAGVQRRGVHGHAGARGGAAAGDELHRGRPFGGVGVEGDGQQRHPDPQQDPEQGGRQQRRIPEGEAGHDGSKPPGQTDDSQHHRSRAADAGRARGLRPGARPLPLDLDGARVSFRNEAVYLYLYGFVPEGAEAPPGDVVGPGGRRVELLDLGGQPAVIRVDLEPQGAACTGRSAGGGRCVRGDQLLFRAPTGH